MHRFMYIILIMIMSVVLVACGDDKVLLIEKGEEVKINEELISNDEVEIIAQSIFKEKNDREQDKYNILFNVTNKYDEEIIVKVESVAFDGEELDSALYSMKNEIKANDMKELTLNITDFDGYKLPELQGEIELNIRVFSWTDPEFSENHKVKLTL